MALRKNSNNRFLWCNPDRGTRRLDGMKSGEDREERVGCGRRMENARLDINANDPLAIKAPRLPDLSQLSAFVPFH